MPLTHPCQISESWYNIYYILEKIAQFISEVSQMMDMIHEWLAVFKDFAVEHILPAVFIAVIGILIVRLLNRAVKRMLERSKLEKAAHSLVISLTQTILYLLLILTVAASLGIDVTGVIALASVLSLALSLSVQDALTNVIGGFTLLYTRPFTSGDYVEIAGQSGTIREIGLAYTKLVTLDNKVISIPNSAVVGAEIVNYTTAGTRRVDFLVSASYGSPPEEVLAALGEAADVPTALADPAPFRGLKAYGESAIDYTLLVWTKSEDYWTTMYAVNWKLHQTFREHGVQMTYPHLNVHIEANPNKDIEG